MFLGYCVIENGMKFPPGFVKCGERGGIPGKNSEKRKKDYWQELKHDHELNRKKNLFFKRK